MERVIKFRAWCEKDKAMYFSDGNYEFRIDADGRISFEPRYGTDELRYYSTDSVDNEDGYKVAVMQFTGIRKKGKDMYEGDVVVYNKEVFDRYGSAWNPRKFQPRNGLVKWNQEHLTYLLHNPLNELEVVSHCTAAIEIIGNIYENPELIN